MYSEESDLPCWHYGVSIYINRVAVFPRFLSFETFIVMFSFLLHHMQSTFMQHVDLVSIFHNFQNIVQSTDLHFQECSGIVSAECLMLITYVGSQSVKCN